MAAPSAPPPSYDEAGFGDNKSQPYPPTQAGGPPPQPYPAFGPGYQQPAAYPPPNTQGYQQATAYPPPNTAAPPPMDYNTNYNDDAEAAFNANSFSDKAVRHSFIKKVYLILMLQLLFTGGLTALFVLYTPIKLWVRGHMWFYILAYVTFFITYIVLACCPSVRRKFPGNYIALGVFTMMFAYVCAAISSFHSAEAVLIAAGITAAVTLSISIFAIQTKIDFTMCSGLIFAAAMTLIFAGLAFMIIRLLIPNDPGSHYILQCVYGSIAALILSLFLVFDTQRIVGGKHRRYQLDPEEHILGAMELYLDIVYIFLIILSCFGSKN